MLADTGMDTGQTGGGLDFSARTDGYKSGEITLQLRVPELIQIYLALQTFLPWQPEAALPMPSALLDSDCLRSMVWQLVQSHSWARWGESFQG